MSLGIRQCIVCPKPRSWTATYARFMGGSRGCQVRTSSLLLCKDAGRLPNVMMRFGQGSCNSYPSLATSCVYIFAKDFTCGSMQHVVTSYSLISASLMSHWSFRRRSCSALDLARRHTYHQVRRYIYNDRVSLNTTGRQRFSNMSRAFTPRASVICTAWRSHPKLCTQTHCQEHAISRCFQSCTSSKAFGCHGFASSGRLLNSILHGMLHACPNCSAV